MPTTTGERLDCQRPLHRSPKCWLIQLWRCSSPIVAGEASQMLGFLHGRANGPHVFGKGIYGMLHCYTVTDITYIIVSYSFQVLHVCICGLTINSWQSFEVLDRRVRILRSPSLVVHEFTTQGHFISWRAHLGISIFLRPERKCTALMWSRWFWIFQVVFLGVRSDGEW